MRGRDFIYKPAPGRIRAQVIKDTKMENRSMTFSTINGHSSPPNEGRPFSYGMARSTSTSGKRPPPVMRRATTEVAVTSHGYHIPTSPISRTPPGSTGSTNPSDGSPTSRGSHCGSFKQSDSGFLDNAVPPSFSANTTSSFVSSLANAGSECPKHSQEALKYYCQLHDELVCADCLAMEPKHQGHTHTRAEDLASSYRSSLLSQLQPLQEMSIEASAALKSMAARRKEISENEETVKESIKMAVLQLHRQLDSRERELLEEAEKISQQKLQHHDAHQDHLQRLTTEMQQLVDSVSVAANDNTNIILCHHKQLSEWVLESTRKYQSLPKEVFTPLQGPNISFVPDAGVMEMCQTIGSVTERQADPQRCYIDESNIKSLTVNQDCVLQLVVHDKDGKPYTSHVKGIKAEAVSTATGLQLDVSIEQDQSKKHQYNISMVPREAGTYLVKVKISNTLVQNSPLTLSVGSVVHGTLVGDIKGVLQPYGITVNPNDEIVVVENGKDCVSLYRSDGKLLKTFSGKGKTKFNRPRGITITPSNMILVTDDEGIKQCTLEGKHMTAFGKIGSGPLEFSFPCGLGVSNDGKIYICDTFNHRVQVLNIDLSFHHYLGIEGNPPAKLVQPYDIAFDSSGKIFVADYSDHSVKMYSPQGGFIGQITSKGENEVLKNPVSVHVNKNDHVFVGEEKTSGLSVYDSSGKYLTMIPVRSSGAYGISSDSEGCVYISDRANRRVQIFK